MTNDLNFTKKLLHSFDDISTIKTVQKGEFLIKEGEIERNIYLIKTGAVRVFYLTEYEEQTIRLGYEGSLINSLSSFLKEFADTDSWYIPELIQYVKENKWFNPYA